MAIDLSDEQREALDAGHAVAIQDGPRTYYVISGGQFEKIVSEQKPSQEGSSEDA